VPSPRHRVTAHTAAAMDIKDKNEFIYFMQVTLFKTFLPSSTDFDPSAPVKTRTMIATSSSTTSFSGPLSLLTAILTVRCPRRSSGA